MKKLLVLLLLLVCNACYAAPSTTVVTATIVDSAGQTWTNATWSATLIPPFGNPATPLNNGGSVMGTQSGTADSTGTFTVTLDDNSVVRPTGTRWQFNICPRASVASCSKVLVFVSGASQNISAILTANITVPTVQANTPLQLAYTDSEVQSGYGGLYLRTSDNHFRIFNGTIFQDVVTNSSTDWANPGALGSNTPNTGVFTNLTVNGTALLTGAYTTNGAGTHNAVETFNAALNAAGISTFTGGLVATSGQNSLNAWKINNTLYVDGVHFTTLAQAVAAATANTEVVVSSPQTITATINLSTNYVSIRCINNATLTYSLNVQFNFTGNYEGMRGCVLVGQGVGTTTAAPINASGNYFTFKENYISAFGQNGSNGTVNIYNGTGDEVEDNWLIGNGDEGIAVVNYTPSSNLSAIRIVHNHVDTSVATLSTAQPIMLHTSVSNSAAEGEIIVADNILRGSKVYCVEVGAFGGATPTDVIVAHNTCTQTQNSTGGGYSIVSVFRTTVSNNIFNGNGFTFGIAGIEFGNAGGPQVDSSISNNIVNAGGNPGTLADGILCSVGCQRLTMTGNSIDGFGTGGNAGGIVLTTSVASGQVTQNVVGLNSIQFPVGGSGKGIWQQCNATGSSCSNNNYGLNQIVGDGTANSIAIQLENDAGTTANNQVALNAIVGVSQGIGVGAGSTNTRIVRGINTSATPLIDNGTGTVIDYTTTAVSFQTNSVANSNQGVLNLLAGSNITLTAGAGGAVTIAGPAGGTGLPATMNYLAPGSTQTALQNALTAATSGSQILLSGIYQACGLTLTQPNVTIYSLNYAGTDLQCNTPGTPVLTVSGSGDHIFNLKLEHITTIPTCAGGDLSTTCGDGLQIAHNTYGIKVDNVYGYKNWNGISWGYTAYGELNNSRFEFNQGKGVAYVPTNVPATAATWVNQVETRGVISQQNALADFDYTCPASFTNVQLKGPHFYGANTFGGNSYAFNFDCSAATTSGIGDIWMYNTFASQPNNDAYRFALGTNGGRNLIINGGYAEQAGTYTGTYGWAAGAATASNVGYGLNIISCDNSPAPKVSNMLFWSNSFAGWTTQCNGTDFTGVGGYLNGQAAGATTAQKSGGLINANNVNVAGGNYPITGSQTSAIYINATTNDTPSIINVTCAAPGALQTQSCVSGAVPTNGFWQGIGNIEIIVGSGVPNAATCTTSHNGWIYIRSDNAGNVSTFYNCKAAIWVANN